MVEYRNKFLEEIKAIKLHSIEFKEDSSINSKVYLKNYTAEDINWPPIVYMKDNEFTSNVNGG